MTKEIYIELRDQQEFPLSLFWEYFKEKGGKYEEREFMEQFPKYMFSNVIVLGENGPRGFNYEKSIARIINYFNSKFGL